MFLNLAASWADSSLVLSRKDRFERGPEVLLLIQLFDGALKVSEHVVEHLDLVHEGRRELFGLLPIDLVQVVDQVVNDLGRRSEDTDCFISMPSC